MSNLLSQNQSALKMLFTEDIYIIPEKEVIPPAQIPAPVEPVKADIKVDNEVSIPVKKDFEYLGDNNKYFLVLIDEKIHTRINPAHQEMLLKIMNAKKLELRDLAILNISRYPDAKFNELKSFFSCSKVLLFGVAPTQVGLPSINLNKASSAGTVKVLATHSLEEMRNSPDKKREFWNIMKNF